MPVWTIRVNAWNIIMVQFHYYVAGYINAIRNLGNVTSLEFVDYQEVIFVNGCEILAQHFNTGSIEVL